jgi:hypothetical protein
LSAFGEVGEEWWEILGAQNYVQRYFEKTTPIKLRTGGGIIESRCVGGL